MKKMKKNKMIFFHLIRIKIVCLAFIKLYFLSVRIKTEMIFVFFLSFTDSLCTPEESAFILNMGSTYSTKTLPR